ncbi:MAG: hypothetical protein HQL34_00655 [Alphaproteobacteria bacterium]|nr:hypothetical protein [Alphaproteobacteria bacterium]
MARNLRKFINPRFTKTVDLSLLRRLFERQLTTQHGIDLTLFDGEAAEVRKALHDFFSGPDDAQPQGLIADLHRIAEFGNENGMRLLLERASKFGVEIEHPHDATGHPIRLDPKHVALLIFLNHQEVFDAASDLLALEARSSLTEFAGAEEGIDPNLDEWAKGLFRQGAGVMFVRELQGDYCRVGWYEDDDETNIVATYGAQITTTPVIDGGEERVISFQSAGHAVLAYAPLTGRLKVGGIAKSLRAELADIFAVAMLDQPEFFAGADSRRLYTLAAVERAGFGFAFDHAFDPGIVRVQIVEVQADRISIDHLTGEERGQWSLIARDSRGNALARLAEMTRGLVFGSESFRLGHMILRVHFDVGRKQPARVTVKIKPPDTAAFKRLMFEARIIELLKRNGFCRDRNPAPAAVAAE